MLDSATQALEPHPKQQRPAPDVFELLLDLADELGGRASKRRVAVGGGTRNEAGAKSSHEATERRVERAVTIARAHAAPPGTSVLGFSQGRSGCAGILRSI